MRALTERLGELRSKRQGSHFDGRSQPLPEVCSNAPKPTREKLERRRIFDANTEFTQRQNGNPGDGSARRMSSIKTARWRRPSGGDAEPLTTLRHGVREQSPNHHDGSGGKVDQASTRGRCHHRVCPSLVAAPIECHCVEPPGNVSARSLGHPSSIASANRRSIPGALLRLKQPVERCAGVCRIGEMPGLTIIDSMASPERIAPPTRPC
jgi:hypothetical protein